jgi:hypothetical protein
MLAVLMVVTPVWAAPPAPATSPGAGVDLFLGAGYSRELLRARDCDADASCNASRADDAQGGGLIIRTGTPLAVYVGAARSHDAIEAAMYDGAGWTGRAGLRADFGASGRGSSPVGAFAWAETSTVRTRAADGSSAERWRVDAGGAAVFGRIEDGVRTWVGAEFNPWRSDDAQVVDGSFGVALGARLPVAAVAGAALVSDPLGGPWSDAGRVSAGLQLRVGGSSGLEGFVAVGF